MTHYQDATRTIACTYLYLAVDRTFWLAEDIKSGAIFGRFNGEWWAA